MVRNRPLGEGGGAVQACENPMIAALAAVRITEAMLRSCLVPAMTEATISTVSPGNGRPTHSRPMRPETTSRP